jgi:hypothetical protein
MDTVLQRPRPLGEHPAAAAAKGAKRPQPAAPAAAVWPVSALAGIGLFAAVVAISLVLNATGSGGGGSLAGEAAANLQSGSSQPAAETPRPGVAAPASTGGAPAATPSATSAAIVFQTWKYRQYAYQVYPGDPSQDAKTALAGFDLSVQDQGDKVLLTLKALSTRYQDASFTVAKGNTAYFIETSARDDPNFVEQNLDDDGLIVVNQQGLIVPRSASS